MGADDPWQRFYDTAAAPRRGNPLLIAAGVAAVVIAAAVVVWLLMRPAGTPGDTPAPAAAPASTTAAAPSSTHETPAPSPPSPADRLLSMLPAGYPARACTAAPADAERGQVAVVDCARNLDPGGPGSASFTLMADPDALAAAFSGVVDGIDVVVCPGKIQSPGPWKRADAAQPSGVLVCGMNRDRSTVAWTDDARRLLVIAHGDPADSALRDLYAWWSGHS